MQRYEILLDKKVQKFLTKANSYIVKLFRAKLEVMQHTPLDSSLDIKRYDE